jgi:hypothetical protein
MLFIVMERFKSREAAAEVYRRLQERGRMLPDIPAMAQKRGFA